MRLLESTFVSLECLFVVLGACWLEPCRAEHETPLTARPTGAPVSLGQPQLPFQE